MRALLRAVMYVVAVAAGIDIYIIARARLGGPALAIVIGAVVAGFVATVPTIAYQRVMRTRYARRHGLDESDDDLGIGPASAEEIAPPVAAAAPVNPPVTTPAPPPTPAATAPTSPAPMPAPAPPPGADVVADSARQLADSERVFGRNHPHTFAARAALAGAYWGMGQLALAIDLYERAVADSERVLGRDHPDTLSRQTDLAAAYEMDGRLAEAIELYERTLVGRERILGANHPDTVTSRSDLAVAYAVRANLSRGRPASDVGKGP